MAARLAAAAEVMASLHRLDPGPAGLGLHDEPVVDGAGEIDRWCALFATVDPALVAGWEDVAAALRARPPAPSAPALVHGDFRLGNLLAHGPRITAVIDWEIWSVGDPRIDVGWFLANADPETYRRPTIYAAPWLLPGPAGLVDIYHRALHRPAAPVAAAGIVAPVADLADLDWFVALARFKSAATWSLIIKHNRRRPAPDPDVEAMAPVLGRLLEQAGGAVS
jgi:aminoglycoside phosphotransferase (APT) family kinase protein